MRIDFRQGIIHAPAGFLSASGSTVSLVIPPNDSVIATIADGTSNYLITERVSVADAWTGVTIATDQWLYWDINLVDGSLSYGITLVEPLVGSAAPTGTIADDQHWFDTATKTMKVWNAVAARWVRRVRVFACKLQGGSTPMSVSINAPAIYGTQAGLTTPATAGSIVFDADGGKPLKRSNGTFFTTEDSTFSHIASSSQVKFASLLIPAMANENIAAYSVVRFADYNKIVTATSFTVDSGAYGIVEQGLTTGDTTNVVMEGLITNAQWDFTIAGGGTGDNVRFPAPLPVNSPLYVDDTGNLTSVAPVLDIVIGAVVDKNTILLRPSSLSSLFAPGLENEPATTSDLGSVLLSVAPAVPAAPVVVGDNDPRLDPPALDDLTDVVITTAANGEVLTFDGTNWVNDTLPAAPTYAIDDLTDVVITTAANGEVLTFDGTNWVNDTLPAAPTYAVDDLTDVVITTAANGEVLTFDGTNWVNDTLPAAPTYAIDDLTDVVITTAANGEVLTFDGTNWVNAVPDSQVPAVVDNANTSIALALTDANTYIRCTAAAGSVTVEVPTLAWEANTEIHIEHSGAASDVTISGTGQTINILSGFTSVIAGQYGVVTLKYVAANTWTLFGALAEAGAPPAV